MAVVVKNRLGALNHTALTLHHLRSGAAGRIACAGLILNEGRNTAEVEDGEGPQEIAVATNRSILEDWLGVPILYSFGKDQASV